MQKCSLSKDSCNASATCNRWLFSPCPKLLTTDRQFQLPHLSTSDLHFIWHVQDPAATPAVLTENATGPLAHIDVPRLPKHDQATANKEDTVLGTSGATQRVKSSNTRKRPGQVCLHHSTMRCPVIICSCWIYMFEVQCLSCFLTCIRCVQEEIDPNEPAAKQKRASARQKSKNGKAKAKKASQVLLSMLISACCLLESCGSDLAALVFGLACCVVGVVQQISVSVENTVCRDGTNKIEKNKIDLQQIPWPSLWLFF